MSNFKPKCSRKRKYKPDSSSNCDFLSPKRNSQSSETWGSFLSNLSVNQPSSKVDNNTELVSTKEKLLKTNECLKTDSLSLEENMPSESWSELLINISQNNIVKEEKIKTEKSRNISVEIKCDKVDSSNLCSIIDLKHEKKLKTEFLCNTPVKSLKLDINDFSFNKDNENLSFGIINENDLKEEINYNHLTSTPIRKPRANHLEICSFGKSFSSVCLSDRSLKQKSVLETNKSRLLPSFRRETQMRNHMKTIHFNDEFPWKCSDCGKTFSVFIDFISHKKVVHNKIVKNWTCYICGEMGGAPHDCPYCEYSNASLSCYRYHLKGHKPSVDRSIVRCHYCDKTFDKKSAMFDHTRSFHRDEKLECQICGMKSTNLSQHISSVHTGEPKTCSICGQQFKYKRDLQMHEKKMHDAKPLAKCDICKIDLPDYYYRKMHMLAHDKHVDENGCYLPLPESEMRKLDGIIKKRRMNKPIRFVSTMCGPDQPSSCSHLLTDVARQRENVLSNSKMVDTLDLKFFLVQIDK